MRRPRGRKKRAAPLTTAPREAALEGRPVPGAASASAAAGMLNGGGRKSCDRRPARHARRRDGAGQAFFFVPPFASAFSMLACVIGW
jgi:hypothetical protein